jgi:CxxC-x17-CxxC domain-containing protein
VLDGQTQTKLFRGGHPKTMSLQEKTAECFDCKAKYTISVEEQEALQAKGYANTPKRCPPCRQARKARQISSGNFRNTQPGFRTERQMYPAVCAQCGKSTQVPFEPREGRPVYCRDCYGAAKVTR